MKTVVDVMMKLIKSEIFNSPYGELSSHGFSGDFLNSLYKLSNHHDVAHIVGSALHKANLLTDNDVSEKFKKQMQLAVFRYEKQKFELENITNILQSSQIPYILLKGSVIRNYYPEPWMRTSCDIDILIHKEDIGIAEKALILAGFKKKKVGYRDISFISPSGVNLELHFTIECNDANHKIFSAANKILSCVWDNVYQGEKAYMFKFTNEFLIFHFFTHTVMHFLDGGCGIKPFIDIKILQDNLPYDKAKLDAILEHCGISAFAENTVKLSQVWFSQEKHAPITLQMQNYILSGGVYGIEANTAAASQAEVGGKSKNILSLIFMPYPLLKIFYPILEKKKYLTPIYQVRRWLRIIFNGRLKFAMNRFKANKNVSDAKLSTVSDMFNTLGLIKKDEV